MKNKLKIKETSRSLVYKTFRFEAIYAYINDADQLSEESEAAYRMINPPKRARRTARKRRAPEQKARGSFQSAVVLQHVSHFWARGQSSF